MFYIYVNIFCNFVGNTDGWTRLNTMVYCTTPVVGAAVPIVCASPVFFSLILFGNSQIRRCAGALTFVGHLAIEKFLCHSWPLTLCHEHRLTALGITFPCVRINPRTFYTMCSRYNLSQNRTHALPVPGSGPVRARIGL
jgi:hypothetical protein